MSEKMAGMDGPNSNPRRNPDALWNKAIRRERRHPKQSAAITERKKARRAREQSDPARAPPPQAKLGNEVRGAPMGA